jgi:hypothetical protein
VSSGSLLPACVGWIWLGRLRREADVGLLLVLLVGRRPDDVWEALSWFSSPFAARDEGREAIAAFHFNDVSVSTSAILPAST